MKKENEALNNRESPVAGEEKLAEASWQDMEKPGHSSGASEPVPVEAVMEEAAGDPADTSGAAGGPKEASLKRSSTSEILLVDKEELKGRLEAVLFAAGDPISVREMAALLEVVPDAVEVLLDEMEREYAGAFRGISILRLDDRLQLATKPEYSRWVLKLAQVNERQTLSKGALECLAIIAYKQPVTRVEVDEIRGVSSDYVMNKLLDRGFITVVGRKNVPGRPKLYATTEEFLRQFGFSNLKVFTGDETYRELMASLGAAEEAEDDIILPVDDEEEGEMELGRTQVSIWDQKEKP